MANENGTWGDPKLTPYQQRLIEMMKANDYRWTFGPNSPNPTQEDLETYVGGRYSPAGGFEGKWALAPKDYYSFTRAQRRALGVMDIAPRNQAGFLERYFGRNDRGGDSISIEPRSLGEPTPRDWSAVSPESWSEPTPSQYPFTGEPAPYNPPPNEFMYPSPVQPTYFNPPPNDVMYPAPLDTYLPPATYNPPVYDQDVTANPVDSYFQDYNNPPPNEKSPFYSDRYLATYNPRDLSNPAPNEESPFYSDRYLPGDDTTGGGYPARTTAPARQAGSNVTWVDTTNVPVSPLSARPGDINLGGLGQPMGYFNSPTYWGTGAPVPYGAYGVGGEGGGIGGPSNWMPLPGSFTPTSFGGSGIIFASGPWGGGGFLGHAGGGREGSRYV